MRKIYSVNLDSDIPMNGGHGREVYIENRESRSYILSSPGEKSRDKSQIFLYLNFHNLNLILDFEDLRR